MMKRNQWIAAAIALLLFSCGAAVGALAHRYYTSTVVIAKSSDDWRKTYIKEMNSKLSLTPNQLNRLEVILDETKAKYRTVRDAYRPAMLEVKEEQIRRVKSLLTPQQVPVYEQLLAERERTSKEQDDRDRLQEQKEAAARAARFKK